MSATAVAPVARRNVVVRWGWTRALVSLLGVIELTVAVHAGPAATVVVGVVAGVVLVVTPWLIGWLHTATAVALLVVGTAPFAALTWWSIITPLLAALALVIGTTVVVGQHRGRHPRSPRRAATS